MKAAGVLEPKRSELLKRFPGLTAAHVRKLKGGMRPTAGIGAFVRTIEANADEMIAAPSSRRLETRGRSGILPARQRKPTSRP